MTTRMNHYTALSPFKLSLAAVPGSYISLHAESVRPAAHRDRGPARAARRGLPGPQSESGRTPAPRASDGSSYGWALGLAAAPAGPGRPGSSSES